MCKTQTFYPRLSLSVAGGGRVVLAFSNRRKPPSVIFDYSPPGIFGETGGGCNYYYHRIVFDRQSRRPGGGRRIGDSRKCVCFIAFHAVFVSRDLVLSVSLVGRDARLDPLDNLESLPVS